MLHRNGSPTALGLARITVFSIWLFSIAVTPVMLYSVLPESLFTPVGVFRFLPPELFHFALNESFLMGLKAALMALCGLLVLGVRPFTPLAVGTCALLLFYDFLMKGFNGYVNHAQLGILYGALVLAVFPAADGLSVMGPSKRPAPRAHYAAPMFVVALLLAFAYSFIGTHRVVQNGLGIFTGDAIVTLLAVRSLEFSATGFGTLPLTLPALAPFLKLGYFITTLFEVLAPLALIYRRFRRLWLAVIIPFHLMTLLTMNIFFWENILLILVFFTGLGYLLPPDRTPTFRMKHGEAAR